MTYKARILAENRLSDGSRYWHSVPIESLWLAALVVQTVLRIQSRGGFAVADVEIVPTDEPPEYTLAQAAQFTGCAPLSRMEAP